MESVGLTSEKKDSGKRKPSKPKSEVQMMIPPKKGRGRRTAAVEKLITWIVAAVESFPAKQDEEIPPVICLPCLDITIKVEIEKTVVLSAPGTGFRDIILKIPMTPQKNGATHHVPDLKFPGLEPQGESDLDQDLVAWMKGVFNEYIVLAGQEPNEGRPWGLQLAKVASCFDVMSWGTKWVKETFGHFLVALIDLMDAAESTQDLDILDGLMKNTVYLDVLADSIEYKALGGAISVVFQNKYDNKYLAFMDASQAPHS